jgi:hypothetical protein
MSWPTYISKGTKADGTAVSSVAPTYPGSIAAGDLLLVFGVIEDSTGDIQTPTGYSNPAENSQTGIATNVSAYLFYKIASGSESGTLTVNGGSLSGGTADYMFAQIYRISGTNITIADTDSTKGTSGTITWDAVNIANASSTLLAMVVNWNDSGSNPDTPSGYTLNASDTSSAVSGMYVELNSKENTASGSSVTASNGSPNGWATFHMSIYNNITISGRSFIVN